MATHSSTLAWKIPWMEEPDRLQSMGSQRVGHDWVTSLSLCMVMGQGWYSLWYCCCAREIVYKNKEAAVHRQSWFTLLERIQMPYVLLTAPPEKARGTWWGWRGSERLTQNTEWACIRLSSPHPSCASSQGVALVWLPGLHQCSKVLSAFLFLSPQPTCPCNRVKNESPITQLLNWTVLSHCNRSLLRASVGGWPATPFIMRYLEKRLRSGRRHHTYGYLSSCNMARGTSGPGPSSTYLWTTGF